MVQESISILVPMFNESEGIESLAKKLDAVIQNLSGRFAVELVLVDDGSLDNTLELAKKYFSGARNCKFLRHEKNRGLGAALKTAFENASGALLFCLDSDCTYEPEIVFDLLKKMDETNADIVTVSPYHPLGKVEGVPANRLILSKGISWLYRLATGSKIHTFTAMVRLYKRKIIDEFSIRKTDFMAVTELLVFPILKGYRAEEIPAVLKTRAYGKSSVRLGKILRLIARHLTFVASVLKIRLLGKKP